MVKQMNRVKAQGVTSNQCAGKRKGGPIPSPLNFFPKNGPACRQRIYNNL